MQAVSVKISNRGHVVLPAKIRKEMNLIAGTRIILSREKDAILLQPVYSFTEKLSGITKGSFGKTAEEVEAYLDMERRDR